IILNNDLFNRIKSVFEKSSELDLSVEEKTLLDNTYKNMSRNGANLSDSDKKIIRKIDKKLDSLTLKFGENLLAETNN
ncbi:MAG: M3 family metallopeptidase, partial [Flavobacteriales bacterium]